jgi:hypothetical protein
MSFILFGLFPILVFGTPDRRAACSGRSGLNAKFGQDPHRQDDVTDHDGSNHDYFF